MNLATNEVEFRLLGEWGDIIESLRLLELTHEILARRFYRARRSKPGYFLYYVVTRPRKQMTLAEAEK